jgi:uncharacterized protein
MPTSLVNRRTGKVVAEIVYRPTALFPRLLGLLVRPMLDRGEALWLDPCGSVHTWGMAYAIDVIFLDAAHTVLQVRSCMRPWRLALAPRGTRSVLELVPGSTQGALAVGDVLEISEG